MFDATYRIERDLKGALAAFDPKRIPSGEVGRLISSLSRIERLSAAAKTMAASVAAEAHVFTSETD